MFVVLFVIIVGSFLFTFYFIYKSNQVFIYFCYCHAIYYWVLRPSEQASIHGISISYPWLYFLNTWLYFVLCCIKQLGIFFAIYDRLVFLSSGVLFLYQDSVSDAWWFYHIAMGWANRCLQIRQHDLCSLGDGLTCSPKIPC